MCGGLRWPQRRGTRLRDEAATIPNFWMIRAGAGDEDSLQVFLEKGIVAKGGAEIGQVPADVTKPKLLERFKKACPEMKDASRTAWAGLRPARSRRTPTTEQGKFGVSNLSKKTTNAAGKTSGGGETSPRVDYIGQRVSFGQVADNGNDACFIMVGGAKLAVFAKKDKSTLIGAVQSARSNWEAMKTGKPERPVLILSGNGKRAYFDIELVGGLERCVRSL